jgi:hypothetical protein
LRPVRVLLPQLLENTVLFPEAQDFMFHRWKIRAPRNWFICFHRHEKRRPR